MVHVYNVHRHNTHIENNRKEVWDGRRGRGDPKRYNTY